MPLIHQFDLSAYTAEIADLEARFQNPKVTYEYLKELRVKHRDDLPMSHPIFSVVGGFRSEYKRILAGREILEKALGFAEDREAKVAFITGLPNSEKKERPDDQSPVSSIELRTFALHGLFLGGFTSFAINTVSSSSHGVGGVAEIKNNVLHQDVALSGREKFAAVSIVLPMSVSPSFRLATVFTDNFDLPDRANLEELDRVVLVPGTAVLYKNQLVRHAACAVGKKENYEGERLLFRLKTERLRPLGLEVSAEQAVREFNKMGKGLLGWVK